MHQKKEIIQGRVWEKLNDHQKIADVYRACIQNKPSEKPSYEYLVSFLADVHNAYREETELRKQLAKYGLAFLTVIVILLAPAAIGIMCLVGIIS